MVDPVLAMHKVRGGVFELSGLRTISIRDQMLRAYLLVVRLIDEKLIGPQRPLLVIGGGVAGVVATMTAAESGVAVTLLEQRPSLFSRQFLSDRWLDPAEYDWPATHWTVGVFPIAGPPPLPTYPHFPMPLRYVAAAANVLAAAWDLQFRLWQGGSPKASNARVIHGMTVSATQIGKRRKWVLFEPTPGAPPIPFGAAISCIGFVGEKTSVPHASPAVVAGGAGQYTGFEFWGSDPHMQPGMGFASGRQGPTRVLISGSGDGALQDFIHALTGKPAREVYNLLFPYSGLPNVGPWANFDLLPFALADDAGRRACAYSARDGHHTLQEWHDIYWPEISKAIFALKLTPGWQARVAAVFRSDVPGLEVTLVYGCRHLSFCYGLNRFVALVLAILHAEQRACAFEDVMLPEHRVVAVDPWNPAMHQCVDPATCHGQPHRVTLDPHTCDGVPATNPPASISHIRFDSVIIRHGVDQRPLFGPAPIWRQIMPFRELM